MDTKRSVSGCGVCEYDGAEKFSPCAAFVYFVAGVVYVVTAFHVRENYTSVRFLLPTCLLFSFGTEGSIWRAGFPHCNLLLLFALKWAVPIAPEKSKFC